MIDPMKSLLGYQLKRASLLIMEDLRKKLSIINLSPACASAIMVIEVNSGIRLVEIGRCLNIKRANMTPLVAKLSKQNLIEKHSIDGRSYGLNLTPEGLEMAKHLHAMISKHEKDCLGHIGEEKQIEIISLLKQVKG